MAQAPVTSWSRPGRSVLVQVTTSSWDSDMTGTVVGLVTPDAISRELDDDNSVLYGVPFRCVRNVRHLHYS